MKGRRELSIVASSRPTRTDERATMVWQSLVAQDAAMVASARDQAAQLAGLRQGAVACLNEGNPRRKAVLTLQVCERYARGELPALAGDGNEADLCVPPQEPARDVQTVDAKDAPRRGKGGSQKNIIKLIHSLCHIESVAIDLSWDMVARFGYKDCGQLAFPKEFLDDWVEVAEEEAIHHLMWDKRLQDLGSHYGEFPSHMALWDTAKETSGDVSQRLCVEHCVLEARGLDVASKTFSKFLNCGDELSAFLLECIYREEIVHVEKGLRWLRFCHQQSGSSQPFPELFRSIVAAKLRGTIKGPFNVKARELAGMEQVLYDSAGEHSGSS